MRLNQFIAAASGLSRRAADVAISNGRVRLNDQPAKIGQLINEADQVTLDGQLLSASENRTTILLNKPVGYVCSRNGQGSQTIYELLPPQFQNLKSVGRLDKDSSGLILLTNDGQLANELTHPRYAKEKIYEITLDKPLTPTDKAKIEQGIKVDDYISQLEFSEIDNPSWRITMRQGRNRQIRRTFEVLGYTVTQLHRTNFGNYDLQGLTSGLWTPVTS